MNGVTSSSGLISNVLSLRGTRRRATSRKSKRQTSYALHLYEYVCFPLVFKALKKICQPNFNKQEKWDSVSRKGRNHKSLMSEVRLFLIDEIHVLGEASRGPVIEAVVSRMKMIAASSRKFEMNEDYLRFVAVSATMPNIDDVIIFNLKPCK